MEPLHHAEPSLSHIGGLIAGCDAKRPETRCATF
jgi:hypothetical protein